MNTSLSAVLKYIMPHIVYGVLLSTYMLRLLLYPAHILYATHRTVVKESISSLLLDRFGRRSDGGGGGDDQDSPERTTAAADTAQQCGGVENSVESSIVSGSGHCMNCTSDASLGNGSSLDDCDTSGEGRRGVSSGRVADAVAEEEEDATVSNKPASGNR